MAAKKVYFVRHGQTDGNLKRYLAGFDEVLNEEGVRQAKIVSGRCQSLSADLILTSDQPRALQTASFIGEAVGLPIAEEPLLRERQHSELVSEASYDSDLYREYNADHEKNWKTGISSYEGDEGFSEMKIRCDHLFKRFLQEDAETIIAVSHSRFTRFVTSYILQAQNPQVEIEFITAKVLKPSNTGITLFQYNEASKMWQLKTWNDIAHFAE